MHLIFAKRFRNIAGTKEEPPDIKAQVRRIDQLITKPPRGNNWNRGVVQKIQLKEGPPDAQHQSHPTRNDIARGKYLDSRLVRDANLFYFGTGCTISWTKFFQGGGDDAAIKTTIDHDTDKMHTGENINTNAKGEVITDASIIHVKAWGTTTTSERDCTVRTAGFDPDPIGDSGTFLDVGKVTHTLSSIHMEQIKGSLPRWSVTQAPGQGLNFYQQIHPEKTNDSGGIIKPRAKPPDDHTNLPVDDYSSANNPRSSSTQPNELPLNIRPTITYLRDLGQDRMHPDQVRIKDGQETSPGTKTKPWKIPREESTRSFHLGFIIQQQTIYLRRNDRARTQLERSHLKLEHKPPLGPLSEPWKLPLRESTQSFSLGSNIHHQTPYSEGLGRAKLPMEPANWKESNLKQFGRFVLSEPTNPDRSSSSNALMFSNNNLKTTCCFRMPKTARTPAPRIGPRKPHSHCTDLPYLEPCASNIQRSSSLQPVRVFETFQDNQRLQRTRTFLPKLTRYKQSRTYRIWSDFVIKAPTALCL